MKIVRRLPRSNIGHLSLLSLLQLCQTRALMLMIVLRIATVHAVVI
jgi:hypothetical protein